MDHQQWSLRLGGLVIVCALLLRLTDTGFFQPVADFLTRPTISSLLLYLETGRIVRFSQSSDVLEAFAVESPEPEFVQSTEETVPVFSAEDTGSIQIKYGCTLRPNLEELLTRPLNWKAEEDKPAVLILHTHTTESYTKSPGESYTETSAYRTLDEGYNMLSIGDHLAELLEAGGISVIHDRELHDYPSYNGSYSHARKSISSYLEENPSIFLVLDLHRDASGDNRNQMDTAAEVDGEPSAQLMLVVGTNAAGLKHPEWEENFSLALKLQVVLERINPGICRSISLRAQRFNQDLSTGALLVEVGAAGDSHEEALNAVQVLAKAILALAAAGKTRS